MSRILTSLWGFEARPDAPQEERHFPACPTAPESSLPAMIAMFPIPSINRRWAKLQQGDSARVSRGELHLPARSTAPGWGGHLISGGQRVLLIPSRNQCRAGTESLRFSAGLPG